MSEDDQQSDPSLVVPPLAAYERGVGAMARREPDIPVKIEGGSAAPAQNRIRVVQVVRDFERAEKEVQRLSGLDRDGKCVYVRAPGILDETR